MYNKATDEILESMRSLNATIGTVQAADLIGISPKGFKRFLENSNPLPDYAIEVTDEGERRTFRIFTERFASFLSCGDPHIEITELEIEPEELIDFRPDPS